ncbi:MAG: FAD-dependent monooxygenase [Candidatus Phosphoribacter sp.]|nr:FAD-dependent monooxygenase [Actinomycetales bacterium]
MTTPATPSSTATPDNPAGQPAVVLGCGPVGQTAALCLASWGVPVVMLDARPERDPIGSKALCQQRDVLDVWDHLGAGRQIAAEGVTWTRAVTLYQGRELFTQGFVDRGHSPFPPFVNIGQNRTEELLDEKIHANPLISERWGRTVEAIEQDDDSITLACRLADGSLERVTGAFCIAAPGNMGHLVRDMVGMSFEGTTFEDQFLICDIRTTLPGWELERRFYFDPEWNPGRQVLIHPCPDSTYRIDWQVPPSYDLQAEQASGALDARIRKIVGDADYEIIWHSVYRFHARQVDRMVAGRLLMAGDGAHLVAPFGARGLNSGVPDAENAAWKVAFVMRGWADPSLIDTYHDERHAAATENLDVTAATMRFLVPQSDAERAQRLAILEAAGTDPEARAQVNSGRMAEPFWYVDSPLTTASETHPFHGRPPKGEDPVAAPGVIAPDVAVTLADGSTARVRALARQGVLVLVGAELDSSAVADAVAGLRCPTTVLSLGEVDPDGTVAAAFGAAPDEAWIVRPDAHISAVATSAAEAGTAAYRAVRARVAASAASPAIA